MQRSVSDLGLYHCHVADHVTAGMITRWTVGDEWRGGRGRSPIRR